MLFSLCCLLLYYKTKEGKNNNATIKDVVIKPIKGRKSITKDSIVGSHLYIGRKVNVT